MFVISKTLLMSKATVIECAGRVIYLNLLAIVLLVLCYVVFIYFILFESYT